MTWSYVPMKDVCRLKL